jgi:hypothetical protein
MKTKEKVEKEFDDKFPYRIYRVAGEPKTEFIESKNKPEQIKSHISKIRKDDIDGLVKIVKEVMGEHTQNCGDSPLRECNWDCPQKPLSDIIAHLLELKEKV